jgi:hypothetical protein
MWLEVGLSNRQTLKPGAWPFVVRGDASLLPNHSLASARVFVCRGVGHTRSR